MHRQSYTRLPKLLLLLLFLTTFVPALIAAQLKCSVCGKRISGQYLKANNRYFCSKRCFNKTLPKCSVCSKRCVNGSYRKDDKFFCSKKCLESTLPKCANCGRPFTSGGIIQGTNKVYCQDCIKLPRCFACTLPANCSKLDDGRNICPACAKSAVYTLEDARKIFDEVRRRMAEELHLSTSHPVTLRMVSIQEMKKRSKNYAPGNELGLYEHKHTKIVSQRTFPGGLFNKSETLKTSRNVNVSNTIYVLYGTPKNKLIEIIAHELAHDWMQQYYPGIKDLKIKEGWAEYVASQINELYGNKTANARMEKSPDPVYGGGYRMICDMISKKGPKALRLYFRKLSNSQSR